jgi:hypothetical protein
MVWESVDESKMREPCSMFLLVTRCATMHDGKAGGEGEDGCVCALTARKLAADADEELSAMVHGGDL